MLDERGLRGFSWTMARPRLENGWLGGRHGLRTVVLHAAA